MLDIRILRENPGYAKARLQTRGRSYGVEIDAVLQLDGERRELIFESEKVKAEQNRVSKLVPEMKKKGEDVSAVFAEMKALSDRTKLASARLAQIEEQLQDILIGIPNLPHDSVPEGSDAEQNVEVRRWRQPTCFGFEPKAHWEIGESLGLLDFARGVKVAGPRFTFLTGLGARLERALLNFCLDGNGKAGYTELLAPYMVNSKSAYGTGNLPKFGDQMFKVQDTDFYLIPTAEVPVTNFHAGETLDARDLPKRYCCLTPCFRSEAGAAGRDTRGYIRMHQFHKVELVKFSLPEQSENELESLTAQAENLLKALELPYRTVICCTGDMGANQVKQYDIEVWMPSYGRYVEISSCSNYGSYQARRAGIRYRPADGGKNEYLHTLNGSALPSPRLVAAVLENYQNVDGSVTVPEVLTPYMGVSVIK